MRKNKKNYDNNIFFDTFDQAPCLIFNLLDYKYSCQVNLFLNSFS